MNLKLGGDYFNAFLFIDQNKFVIGISSLASKPAKELIFMEHKDNQLMIDLDRLFSGWTSDKYAIKFLIANFCSGVLKNFNKPKRILFDLFALIFDF